ncbi:hypothetical protein ACJ4V0_01870 [Phreatobacter sp. HK31-P]
MAGFELGVGVAANLAAGAILHLRQAFQNAASDAARARVQRLELAALQIARNQPAKRSALGLRKALGLFGAW